MVMIIHRGRLRKEIFLIRYSDTRIYVRELSKKEYEEILQLTGQNP